MAFNYYAMLVHDENTYNDMKRKSLENTYTHQNLAKPWNIGQLKLGLAFIFEPQISRGMLEVDKSNR